MTSLLKSLGSLVYNRVFVTISKRLGSVVVKGLHEDLGFQVQIQVRFYRFRLYKVTQSPLVIYVLIMALSKEKSALDSNNAQSQSSHSFLHRLCNIIED